MTGFVDGLKDVQAVDQQIAALDGQITAHMASIAALGVAHRQAAAEWNERAKAAFAKGAPFTDRRPVESDALGPATEFLDGLRANRERLMRERQQAVMAGGEKVIVEASKAVSATVEKTRPLLEELETQVAIIRGAQSALAEVRAAVFMIKGERITDDARPASAMTLVGDVAAGRDPIEPDIRPTKRLLGLQKPEPSSGAEADAFQIRARERDAETARLAKRAIEVQAAALRHERPFGYRGGDRIR
ncbi:hypothetical protein AERO_08220 [Aeromicrobium fastidiosum]|uniref:hypothetical protein n=1 Tax=Aeromicrobium fastidiosum TaxID=52699 RepID=UPI002023457B|nr:hypothetical protein [Aeromicrobium fastidiosum]MCL8251367.1 hypothetical protein [Aeromicrobium fastidiosum]